MPFPETNHPILADVEEHVLTASQHKGVHFNRKCADPALAVLVRMIHLNQGVFMAVIRLSCHLAGQKPSNALQKARLYHVQFRLTKNKKGGRGAEGREDATNSSVCK